MTDVLKMALNDIVSYMAEGECWHRRMANQCRKVSVRGWGRWHEAEAMDDAKWRMCLEKILMDNLGFEPTLDLSHANKAENMMLNSHNDFKSHHSEWIKREERLIEALNRGIHESREANIELYEKLCCIQKEVQNERMRVELIYNRLQLASWNGHDIGVCSMIIHKYFECEYDGGAIDFNVGKGLVCEECACVDISLFLRIVGAPCPGQAWCSLLYCVCVCEL